MMQSFCPAAVTMAYRIGAFLMKGVVCMPEVLAQTARLRIVRLDASMAAGIHRLSLDEHNRRFLPDEVFETEAEAAAVIDVLMANDAAGCGALVYPVQLTDGTQIGHVEAAPEEEGWEIGYHIGAEYCGKGYATEAVAAFLPVIMARLGVTEMQGVCLAENEASRRVLERCGGTLVYEGKGSYQGEELSLCRYELRQ